MLRHHHRCRPPVVRHVPRLEATRRAAQRHEQTRPPLEANSRALDIEMILPRDSGLFKRICAHD